MCCVLPRKEELLVGSVGGTPPPCSRAPSNFRGLLAEAVWNEHIRRTRVFVSTRRVPHSTPRRTARFFTPHTPNTPFWNRLGGGGGVSVLLLSPCSLSLTHAILRLFAPLYMVWLSLSLLYCASSGGWQPEKEPNRSRHRVSHPSWTHRPWWVVVVVGVGGWWAQPKRVTTPRDIWVGWGKCGGFFVVVVSLPSISKLILEGNCWWVFNKFLMFKNKCDQRFFFWKINH